MWVVQRYRVGCPNDGVGRGVWTVLDKVSKRCQAGCPGAVGWGEALGLYPNHSNCSPLPFFFGGGPLNDCVKKQNFSLLSKPSFPLPTHSRHGFSQDHPNATSSEKPSLAPSLTGTPLPGSLNLGPPAGPACPRLCCLLTGLWTHRGLSPHAG